MLNNGGRGEEASPGEGISPGLCGFLVGVAFVDPPPPPPPRLGVLDSVPLPFESIFLPDAVRVFPPGELLDEVALRAALLLWPAGCWLIALREDWLLEPAIR